MPTTAYSGNTYHLGFIRGPERPQKWLLELKPKVIDRSKPRSLRRFYLQPPFDQGAIGSCTANSGCLAAMACAAIDGVQVPTFSRMWMYYNERMDIGTFPQDSGAYVIEEYNVDSQKGAITETAWPYDANVAATPPAAATAAKRYTTVAAYQPIQAGGQSTIDSILTALDNQQPVVIGLLWDSSFTTAYEHGDIVVPSMLHKIVGGHALAIVGWVPPSTAHPNGVFVLQGSWGSASPADAIFSDARAGDHYFDASLFTSSFQGQVIVSDIYAAVPMAAPATLSLSITPPATAQVGQPSVWYATVTGLPAGSVATYSWTFSDGGEAMGPSVSYAARASGTLTGSCTVNVATTGAQASNTASCAVSPAPQASVPTLTPLPSTRQQTVKQECIRCKQQVDITRRIWFMHSIDEAYICHHCAAIVIGTSYQFSSTLQTASPTP